MEGCGRAILYVLLVFNSLLASEYKSVPLNACPLYGEWYSCVNHLFAECKYTYHPWCISNYGSVSNQCLIIGCDFTFIALFRLVWSIREFALTESSVFEVKNLVLK